VDGHLHHDHQKRDLQVSKKEVFYSCKGLKMGKEGSRGEGSVKRSVLMKMLCIYVHIVAHVCSHLINIVFRL
jgi:hypothetical protein